MNEKYSLKIIQHGKTQQVRTVQNGAGMAGQAVVIQATEAARFQLVNVVTLVSPSKLQLKRVGDALHLVLPGGDIDAPDLVIQDYFKVTGVSLQGSSISGEWMNYDTAGLVTNPAPSVVGADTLSSGVIDKSSNVSLGGGGVLETFTEHPWLWVGGVVGAVAAGGGGGSGGSTPTSDTSPLGVIRAYANAIAGAGVTAPTLATYKSAGVKALVNLSEAAASAEIDSPAVAAAMGGTWLASINSAVDKRTDGSTLTVAQLQALVDSYYRILSEADGVVNTSTDTIVYPSMGISNPIAADYTNIGVTLGSAKSVDLLNDFVGQSRKAAVDTVDEINTVATAAYNVMIKAGVVASKESLPAVYTLDSEWITGLTALGIVGVNANNIVAVKDAIAATSTKGTSNDGMEVDTVLEIKDLVKGVIALQVMVDYANTNGTSTVPTLSTYTDAGIKAFNNLSDTADAGRVALSVSNADINALNSAVDKLTGSSLTLNSSSTLFDGTLQKMVDSYYRILKEADGSTTTNTDVYADTTNDAINAGLYNDPTATDYANIGVTKVDGTALTVVSPANTEILVLLNDAVGRFSTASVDTVAELSALEKAAENIMAVAAGTGTGLATVGVTYVTDAEWIAGFTALGVTGVTAANLAAVKKVIDKADSANTGTAVDTVQELLDLVKPVIALQVLVDYTNTNGTSTVPTLSTYTDAGIKAFNNLSDTADAGRVALSVSNADINALNSAVDKLTGSSLTLNSSSTLFDGTLQKMVDSYYRILKEADGKYIGDANGGATYYDGSTVAKTADTDVYADTTNDAANAAAYNDPTATDYANIGVTKTNGAALTVASVANTEILALLNNAVGRFNTTKVDTIAKLSALETAAENVFALSSSGALGTVSYTGATADADWVAGLTALGVTGVTTRNITAVKAAIDAKDSANDGTAVDTVAELQTLVSLTRIMAFTNDAAAIGSKVADTPTLADWGALVNVNTSLLDPTLINLDAAAYWKTSNPFNGVNALNSALDTYAGDSTLSSAKLKTIADAYGRVLQEADNSRATNTDVSKVDNSGNVDLVVADLTNLGVTFLNTPGTATTLLSEQNLVLGAIPGLASTSVDTVTELNDLAKAANNVVKQAAGGTGGNLVTYLDSEWVSALSSLSISGANTSNIAAIKTAIIATADDGTGVDSYNELQSLVSLVRVNDYAALNTGYILPTIEDYQALVAQYGTATDKTTYNLTGSAGNNAGGTDLAYLNASSAYLSSYNDAVNYKPSNAFTGLEVKNMVLAYNSILAEANGAATDQTTYDPLGSDYTAVGVTAVSAVLGAAMLGVAEYAALLTDVVANKSTSQVDQVSELDALANIIVKIQDLEGKSAVVDATTYTAITGGALQVSELAALGLNITNLTDGTGTVLTKRLNYVYDNIIAIDHNSAVSRATLDSLVEMQALINSTIVI